MTDQKPRRAVTDSIVEAVHIARSEPSEWIKLGHEFKTRENAASTASCVRRGFLRVRPKQGEKTLTLGDKTYLALPARCEVKVQHEGESYWLWLRARPARRRVRVRRLTNPLAG